MDKWCCSPERSGFRILDGGGQFAFEALLTEETAPRFFSVAFDLAQYVCCAAIPSAACCVLRGRSIANSVTYTEELDRDFHGLGSFLLLRKNRRS